MRSACGSHSSSPSPCGRPTMFSAEPACWWDRIPWSELYCKGVGVGWGGVGGSRQKGVQGVVGGNLHSNTTDLFSCWVSDLFFFFIADFLKCLFILPGNFRNASTHTHTQTHKCMHACTCTCTQAFMYTYCTHTHTHIHTHTHTHTHTQKNKPSRNFVKSV